MSFKRSPLFRFESVRTKSPPSLRRCAKVCRRERASTGELRPGFVLVDEDKHALRTACYHLHVANLNVEQLRELVFTKMRHPQKLDEEYENVVIDTSESKKPGAKAELIIRVIVSPDKKWTSTGSDIYLHYLLKLRKNHVVVVTDESDVSSIVVDRIAAHHDYTLVAPRCRS